MGDNAESAADRYVFWQTSYLGAAQDRWPLIMNGQYAAFNPRFTGNTSTGTMTSATMYLDYTNGRVGIGTNAPVATLHNSGSTVFSSNTIADLPAGGAIGTAATTVDVKTTFNINQTTANQTLTLPSPTDATAGRIVYINNVGTVGFTMSNQRIETGQSFQFIWNGTAWETVGGASNEEKVTAIKAANQTFINTTLTNVTDMNFSIAANEQWIVTYNIENSAPIAADKKFAVTAPAGATCSLSVNDGLGRAGISNVACGVATGLITANVATAGESQIVVSVKNGATAGVVQLQAAEFATSGIMTIYAGSSMTAYRFRGADLAEVYYTNDGSIRE